MAQTDQVFISLDVGGEALYSSQGRSAYLRQVDDQVIRGQLENYIIPNN